MKRGKGRPGVKTLQVYLIQITRGEHEKLQALNREGVITLSSQPGSPLEIQRTSGCTEEQHLPNTLHVQHGDSTNLREGQGTPSPGQPPESSAATTACNIYSSFLLPHISEKNSVRLGPKARTCNQVDYCCCRHTPLPPNKKQSWPLRRASQPRTTRTAFSGGQKDRRMVYARLPAPPLPCPPGGGPGGTVPATRRPC